MGLDMYLYGAEYEPKIRDKNKKSYYTLTEEIYWRKSNWFHRWFVDNVQDGEDNCAYHNFSKHDLKALKESCQKVLENPELASEILPTQCGFFFGNTEYDEWYYKDIENTLEKLEELLSEDKYDEYFYHSSW